jgi:hypothetical protein
MVNRVKDATQAKRSVRDAGYVRTN